MDEKEMNLYLYDGIGGVGKGKAVFSILSEMGKDSELVTFREDKSDEGKKDNSDE